MSLRRWTRNQLVKVLGRFRQAHDPDIEEPTFRVLSYHRIRPEQQVAFQHQLDRLQAKYNIVTPSEFRSKTGSTDRLNLLLTFDDGFLDWESQVLPELDQRGIKAVFFVCPDLVGLDEPAAADYCRKYLKLEPALALTPAGVERIREDGHRLGNHLVRHTDLRDIEDPSRVLEVLEESRETFQKRTGTTTSWLAYPFGDSFRAPGVVRSGVEEFFELAFTLIPGTNRSPSDPFFLHRDAFSPAYSAALERAWLAGGYDPLFRLTHLFRSTPG